METLLGIGLGNAILAAVLALAAAGIGARCRRPALVHGLWLIVLLKLLTPPLWRVDVRSVLPEPPTRATPLFALTSDVAKAGPVVAEDRAGPTDPIWVAPREMEVPVDFGRSAAVRERSVVPAPPARAGAPKDSPGFASVLPDRWLSWAVAVVWAVGSVVCAAMIVVRVVRFGRLLRFADPAPDEVQDLAAMLGRRIGLTRSPPRVWFVPGSVCPMLWAVGGRPRVLVPRELWRILNARQRSSLLVHELAHLRRRDHWVRGVELLVAVAYWWFPVAWWARRRLREAEEQCCDAWVVWALPGSGREYAGALLEAVEFVSTGARLPVLASGMGQFASLKRRMTMIRSERVPRALTWYGRIGIVAVGGLLLPMAPTRAQSVSESKAETTVKFVTPAVTTVRAEDERSVIAELSIRTDDDEDDNDRSESKDKAKAQKEKAKAAKDAAKEAKDAAKEAKEREAKDREAKEREARTNSNRDRREVRRDGKGAEGDDELAAAREEVRELSKELDKAAQRLAKLEARRHGGQGAVRAAGGPTPPMPPVPPIKPNSPQVYAGKPVPPVPGEAGRGNRFDPGAAAAERGREQRLQAMENRLRAMMNELEAMRRERDAKPRTTPEAPAK